MDEEEPNCNICFEPFDDDEHSPRTLRCGHTLCTPCIDVLVKKNLPDRVCPECRKTLKISNPSHLPISYTILRLSRALTKSKPATEVQVQVLDSNTCMKHGAPTISWCPLSDKWHCFKCVHVDKCDSLLSVPEAFLHIKQNYSQIIGSKVGNASNLSDSLEKERDTLKREISASEKMVDDIGSKLEKVKEWTGQLENNEAEMIEAASMIRLSKSLKRLKRDVAEFDSWLERAQPSVRTRIMQTPSPSTLSTPVNFVMLKEQLKITQTIYAVHECEEYETRWSKITLDGFNVLMWCLEDEKPPENALTIPFESVIKALDKDNPVAFFEISCQNKVEGRVCIEMMGKTVRGLQFLQLCTGQEGPTYRTCKLMEFEEDHHRYLRGGVSSESIYSEGLFDDITDGGVYRHTLVPGLVTGWKSQDEYWALCDIILECKAGYQDEYSFGKVVSGLSILKGVCENNKDKKAIEISNCGVIVEM